MEQGVIETARTFDKVYRGFSLSDQKERYETLKSWVTKGWIQDEVQEMDKLLELLKNKEVNRLKQYIHSGNYNTFTCGFYDMPVTGFNFYMYNETISDHFAKNMRLRGACSSMPFYFIENEKVNTPFYLDLQEKSGEILHRCHQYKREILTTNPQISAQATDRKDAILLYLLQEEERLDGVIKISVDMKRIYGTITDIIDAMGN